MSPSGSNVTSRLVSKTFGMAIVQQLVTPNAYSDPDWRDMVKGMVSDRENPVLRRKARVARDQLEARVMSAPRALRLAMEQAADIVLHQPLAVTGTERFIADPASLPDMVPDGALVLLLDGPQAANGALIIEEEIATGVVEALTTGEVLATGGASRALTRTDAALSEPLIDSVLDRFARNLANGPDAHWSAGFVVGAMQDAPRVLRTALAAARYHVFRVALKLGDAGREGGVVMALPIPEEPTSRDASSLGDAQPDPQWKDRILGTQIRLDAILCRLEIPLSQVMGLRPGDVLPIAQDALRDVHLETGARRPVARCRLGQMGGRRALRLTAGGPQTSADPQQADWVSGGFPVRAEDEHKETSVRSMYDADLMTEGDSNVALVPEETVDAAAEVQSLESEADEHAQSMSDTNFDALTRTV